MFKTVLVVLLAALPSLAALSAEAPAIVDVVGVRVVAPVREGEGDEMRAFNWSPGTTVALVVRKASGGIIEVSADNSKLTLCKDDKGTDLLKAPAVSKFERSGFGAFPKVSADGKALMVEAAVQAMPARGATQLQLAGEIAMQVATQKKDFPASVTIKDGEKIVAGALTLTIGKTGAPDWGGEDFKFAVRLKATQALSSVASIKFFDEQGKEIESKLGSRSSFGFGSQMNVEQEYLFKAPVTKAKVVVSCWTDMQMVKVPVNLKAGIGL